MEELLKNFEIILQTYNDGDLTSDEFFKWFCDQIEKYGGKLPPKKDDESIPPYKNKK
jgi:hypothetical protein